MQYESSIFYLNILFIYTIDIRPLDQTSHRAKIVIENAYFGIMLLPKMDNIFQNNLKHSFAHVLLEPICAPTAVI